MKLTKSFLFIFFINIAVAIGCQYKSQEITLPQENTGKAAEASSQNLKYVFLFIGDGMGVNQVFLAEQYKNEVLGDASSLTMNEFPFSTTVSTHSKNSNVTDSAAAGTALATGTKTYNGKIAITEEGEPLNAITYRAKKAGLKIGILSDVSIDHATPASFYAHQSSRTLYYEIGAELSKSGFDYFAGGSFKYPKGSTEKLPDLFSLTRDAGYAVVQTVEGFKALNEPKAYAVSPDVLSKGEMPYVIDGTSTISLATFLKKGIDLLSGESGFFLMIEGGKIDWTCHENDAASTIHEVLAFDDSVKTAHAFYEKHPDETLIVITADHETGGLGLGNNYLNMKTKVELLKYQNVSFHLFQEKLRGLSDENSPVVFEEVLKMIETDFGINQVPALTLTELELEDLKTVFGASFKEGASVPLVSKFTRAVLNLMSQKAGLGWTTLKHSAAPVYVKAIGVGAEQFLTAEDNTDIHKILVDVMKL